MALDISNMTQDITNNITNNVFSAILEKIKPGLYIIAILAVLFLIYKIAKYILDRIRDRRITKTYHNSEEILKKLENIEKKLGISKKANPELKKQKKNS